MWFFCLLITFSFCYLILRMRYKTWWRFYFRWKKCPMMCLKINWFVKTPWLGPSMEVARSGLWAPVFIYSTNILVRLLTVDMKNYLTQKNQKTCDPILVTLLKIRPHYSQSGHENATTSSGTSPTTSPLASYEQVDLPCFSIKKIKKLRARSPC